MKVLKFLSIPTMALGMLTLLTATASANHATISAKLDCSSTTASKVCFNLTVSTADFPQDGRQISVTLLGHAKGDANASHFVPVSGPQTVPLAQNLDNAQIPLCFTNVQTSGFDNFKLDIEAVGPDFDVNGQTEVKLGPFQNNCQTATPTPTPTPTPTMSPSPSNGGNGGGSPTPTASANTTVALAQTGGFDFRYPLIGLILLVAGGALFVVSASRGRSAQTK